MTNFKLSTTHRNFSECLNDSRALEHPEEYLGPNWKNILNLWIYLDRLNDEQIGVFAIKFNRNLNSYCYNVKLWNYCESYSQFSNEIFNVTPIGFDYVVLEITCLQLLMEKEKFLTYLPILLTT